MNTRLNLARKFLYRKSCKLCLMVVNDSFKSIEGTEFHSLGMRVKNSFLEEFVEVKRCNILDDDIMW